MFNKKQGDDEMFEKKEDKWLFVGAGTPKLIRESNLLQELNKYRKID